MESIDFGSDAVAIFLQGYDARCIAFMMRGQPGDPTVQLRERLQRGFDAFHRGAVELDLLADVPVQGARDEFLKALSDGVLEARRTRVDGADRGDLGFGGIAGVQ